MTNGHTHRALMFVVLSCVLLLGSSAATAGPGRLRTARMNHHAQNVQRFKDAGLSYPPREIFLRAFKKEGVLELWAGNGDGQSRLTKIRDYRVCAASGILGPKNREGDLQVPEGFYEIDRFNAQSAFHLSLGINYPNAADRARLAGEKRLGGDIFIHGNCVTVGCLPLEDGPIEELYLVVIDAHLTSKQKRIPVHIFPSRMDDAGWAALLERQRPDEALRRFWEDLRPGFTAFETSGRPPRVTVDQGTGRYRVTAR